MSRSNPQERTLTTKFTKKQRTLRNAFKNPQYDEILFGGGARGGKTWGVAEIVVITCLYRPGIKWMIGRKERDDLRKTSVATLIKVFRKHGMEHGREYKINRQTKEISFYNGSGIFLVPLKQQPSDLEFNRLGSYEITFAWVDEGQEVVRQAIDILKSRCTEKVKEYNLNPKVIITCNPMKCHLYNDFIKPQKDGTIRENRIFIPSLYTDNPHIDHTKYFKSLENASKVTKERLLFGNREYDDDPTKLFEYDDICALFTNKGDPGEKYISCDVARLGDDKTTIFRRDGLTAHVKRYSKNTTDVTAAIIDEEAQEHQIKRNNIVIDEDGVGGGVVDQLKGVKGFVNNSSPIATEREKAIEKIDGTKRQNFANLKTQCYYLLREYIKAGRIRLIVDDETTKELIIQELDVIKQEKVDSDGPLRINDKNSQKKLLGRSPDFADCLMMRMYFELKPKKKLQIGIF